MGTVASLIESARYDLADYEEGLAFDDRLLYLYLNRMIKIMDSQLAALRDEAIFGYENAIDTVASQDYIDLTYMNNGYWDSIREVWIGEDRKQPIPLDLMYYKRKFRTDDAEPQFWCTEGRRVIWETGADSAHTDLIIQYNKKHRPRLESWSDTFTSNATTDAITLATGRATFVTGDGPFQVSNSGGALPTGLSASTDYWLIFDDPSDIDAYQLASSKDNALAGTEIDITATGSGTHTITLQSDVMPYDGIYDEIIREMLVMHGRAKQSGNVGNAEQIYGQVFRKRAFEERLRRNWTPKYYRLDF